MTTKIDQQQLAQELVDRARAEGVELVGQGGLLTGLMKSVLGTALEAEVTGHLGCDKHDSMGRNGWPQTSFCRAVNVALANRRSERTGSSVDR